ncbi:hypothetical protein BB558_003080 [Smittium angustum]|nr:hypothetical protein BB558_003080 [Smittium angustum]
MTFAEAKALINTNNYTLKQELDTEKIENVKNDVIIEIDSKILGTNENSLENIKPVQHSIKPTEFTAKSDLSNIDSNTDSSVEINVSCNYNTDKSNVDIYSCNKDDSKQNVPSIDDCEELDCLICFETLLESDKIRKIPCSHIFHKKCLDTWLISRSGLCPICRYGLHTEKPKVQPEPDESAGTANGYFLYYPGF